MLIIVILLLSMPVRADFFTGGFGPRPVALGGSFVAIADDINAIFYNPAGLTGISGARVATMYSRIMPNIPGSNLNFQYLGGTYSTDNWGSFGAAVTNLSLAEMRQNIVYLSAGYEVLPGLSVGASAKILHWQAQGYQDAETGVKDKDFSFTGFSIDAAVLYTYAPEAGSFMADVLQAKKLTAGLAIQDINQPSIAENGDADAAIPVIIDGGVAWFHDLIMITAGFRMKEDIVTYHFGKEYKLLEADSDWGMNRLFVRAGVVPEFDEETGSETGFGFGYRLGAFALDYGMGYSLNLLDVGGSHKFSIEYSF
jgi:hypothetical protein